MRLSSSIVPAAAAAAALLLNLPQAQAAPSAAAQPPAHTDPGLTRLLEGELARFPATSGIYIKHLGTGQEATVRGDEHFRSASTIKMGVMVLAFRLADQGKLDLDKRYELKAADMRGGSGILKYMDTGLRLTLRDVITQMIITSDNTATDIMIAQVGGAQKVNEFLREAGFGGLHLNKTTFEFFRQRYESLDSQYSALTPQDVFALQSNRSSFPGTHPELLGEVRKKLEAERNASRHAAPASGRAAGGPQEPESQWFGIATPTTMGRLLEGIERHTIASAQSCEEMKRIMLGQQAGQLKVPHYLARRVAHKTGETNNVTNDVGMIYAHSGVIIFSFYNMNVVGMRALTEDRMGQVARLIVEYFDGVN